MMVMITVIAETVLKKEIAMLAIRRTMLHYSVTLRNDNTMYFTVLMIQGLARSCGQRCRLSRAWHLEAGATFRQSDN